MPGRGGCSLAVAAQGEKARRIPPRIKLRHIRGMPNYRRNRVPGGTFFVTVNLLDRRSALFDEIDELPRRRSSYIATNCMVAMRCCWGGCTMNYNTISAQRVAGALGAEIAGVDLSRPLSDEVIGEIRQALLDHQVIFFHDQHLTSEQHLAFGRRFGELQIHDFVEPAEEDR